MSLCLKLILSSSSNFYYKMCKPIELADDSLLKLAINAKIVWLILIITSGFKMESCMALITRFTDCAHKLDSNNEHMTESKIIPAWFLLKTLSPYMKQRTKHKN